VLDNDRALPNAEVDGTRLPQAEYLRDLLRDYRGRAYPGNAILFRTVGDLGSFELEAGRSNGWAALISGKIQVEEFRCGHMDLSEEPHVQEVAKRLKECLLKAEAAKRRQN
jgi:thioesterase domain-containing protein